MVPLKSLTDRRIIFRFFSPDSPEPMTVRDKIDEEASKTKSNLSPHRGPQQMDFSILAEQEILDVVDHTPSIILD